jgi:hypothetical protein
MIGTCLPGTAREDNNHMIAIGHSKFHRLNPGLIGMMRKIKEPRKRMQKTMRLNAVICLHFPSHHALTELFYHLTGQVGSTRAIGRSTR